MAITARSGIVGVASDLVPIVVHVSRQLDMPHKPQVTLPDTKEPQKHAALLERHREHVASVQHLVPLVADFSVGAQERGAMRCRAGAGVPRSGRRSRSPTGRSSPGRAPRASAGAGAAAGS